MNFVAQLEEYLRDLGAEARKKHPGVKEASERAILKLRSLQNQYVIAVRKAAAQGEKHPDTTLFRSSDLLHPFLLAANYPNASPKLLDTSFKAMKSLMEANAICPGDGMNMVRVWIIQAHVVVSYSSTTTGNATTSKATTKQDDSDMSSRDLDRSDSNAPFSTTASTLASTSSWLGSFLSSSSAAATETVKSTANSVVNKTAVSSSHGQAGAGHINAKFLEKIALDILSCLLQLLELGDLPVTKEQWTQSVTLCCLFLRLKQPVVRQAAKSALPHVLTLLFRNDDKFAMQTWEDLAACISTTPITATKKAFQGAFAQCRVSEKDSPILPSLAISMALMTKLLQDHPKVFATVGRKTLGILVQTLQKLKSKLPTHPLDFIRVLQFILTMFQTQADSWPNECREIMLHIIEPITTVTEALRHQPEFEDGYVYRQTGDASPSTFEVVKSLPPMTLWKAGLCLETIKVAVHQPETRAIWMHQDVLVPLVEAVSDFCTIAASCQDNIQLLVGACRHPKSLLFLAENSATSTDDSTWWVNGKDSNQQYVLGNALWTGLEGMLKLVDPQLETSVFEDAFSPFLALLQHYLKRFPASGTIVKRSLEGYYKLATISFKFGPMQRCALLSSLCKLSLPQWGNQNAQSRLRDNHVAALICLLNVVHKLHDHIGSDWQVIMQTFEELSILHIASPELSDSAYESALCVSAVFGRFAAFSTCLSDESLNALSESLMEVAVTTSQIPTGTGTSGMTKLDSSEMGGTNHGGKEEAGTISGKLIHLGVRALYGAGENPNGNENDIPLASRTKETFCYHYKAEMSQRLAASKHPVRTDRLRFVTALLCDIALTNAYRFDKIGPTISQQLCSISSKSRDDKDFAFDSIAMITLSHLAESFKIATISEGPSRIKYADPRQNQYLIVEAAAAETANEASADASASAGGSAAQGEAAKTPQDITQKDLLLPLCSCIQKEENHQVTESALAAMHSIIESAGHRLAGAAWITMIDAIASVNQQGRYSNEWGGSCLAAFQCLRLIVEDFLDATDEATGSSAALLECCFSFALSKQDVNTSLTSIGLLWKIADRSRTSDTVELPLSKLARVSADSRAEVRNCAVNTLFSCIVGRGHELSAAQWKSCLCETVLGVHSSVTSHGKTKDSDADNKDAGEESKNGQTPTRSRYRLNVHHSRDSEGKQWIATQAIVIRGICRVLRSFFNVLLDTVESSQSSKASKESDAWFEDVWNQFLNYSLAATAVEVGRDTMDLRNAGADLMVLSCQLACRAGIQAAITPARVSTNMEVVNGALRNVRTPDKDNMASSSRERLNSSIVETCRENLFLDAFDVLESYRGFLETSETTTDSTQVQILSKFANDLGKLYECCKSNEFREADHSFLLNDGSVAETEQSSDSDDVDEQINPNKLVQRFLSVVMTVATRTANRTSSRFLSLAQKAAMDVMKVMVLAGSSRALVMLTRLMGNNFLCKDSKIEGSTLLGYEAATILTDAVQKPTVPSVCKAYVLRCAFRVLADEWPASVETDLRLLGDGYTFQSLSTMMKHGVKAARQMQMTIATAATPDLVEQALLQQLWDTICQGLDAMLPAVSQVDATQEGVRSGVLDEVLEMVKSLQSKVPASSVEVICGTLSASANHSLMQAKAAALKASEAARERREPAEASSQENASLNLLISCISTVLSLDPKTVQMKDLCKTIFAAATVESQESNTFGSTVPIHILASLRICQELRKMSGVVEPFVVSMYSSLCSLAVTGTPNLRAAAGGVLGMVDIGEMIHQTQQSLEQAESRADAAEARCKELSESLEEANKRNDLLDRQFAAVSAGSTLGLT